MNSKQNKAKKAHINTQGVPERMKSNTVAELSPASTSVPQNLIDPAILNSLPSHYRCDVDEAIKLYYFVETNEGMNYAPVFTPPLGAIEKVATDWIVRCLQPELPIAVDEQKAWFTPSLRHVDRKSRKSKDYYRKLAQNLKRTLVFSNGLSLIGLLRSCLDYALNDTTKIGGVFEALHTQLRFEDGRKFLKAITRINKFRNTYIAHPKKKLTNKNLAKQKLKFWIEALHMISLYLSQRSFAPKPVFN